MGKYLRVKWENLKKFKNQRHTYKQPFIDDQEKEDKLSKSDEEDDDEIES